MIAWWISLKAAWVTAKVVVYPLVRELAEHYLDDGHIDRREWHHIADVVYDEWSKTHG